MPAPQTRSFQVCAWILLIGVGAGGVLLVGASLPEVGFYSRSCPDAESVVRSTVLSHSTRDRSLLAGLLRLFFHDCFVQGCDGSILIDGPFAERTAPGSTRLRGFEVINDAKQALEKQCPKTVSCADILALAAREVVVLSGGPTWDVPTGRLDGLVSNASNVDLPTPTDSVPDLINKFSKKGFSIKQLVALSGAHTLGTATCDFFSYRLYDFMDTQVPDPTLSPAYLPILRLQCPLEEEEDEGNEAKVELNKDTEGAFDNSYFINLNKGNGLLESDQKLAMHPSTKPFVDLFARSSQQVFHQSFVEAMKNLSLIEVVTSENGHGEIRTVCTSFNLK